MNWLQAAAQISVGHIVNAIPEGILIAAFAWAMLRVLRRQNSGTRFAVWFFALLTVAALPFVASLAEGGLLGAAQTSVGSLRPPISIPAHWALTVFFAWILGVAVSMVRLAIGLWHLRKLRRSCVPVVLSDLDPTVRNTLQTICVPESSASRAITVATSECVRVPAAIGFWKRTIVLPAWTLRELSPGDLNVVLLHEFAHLQRADNWTNLIQKIVRAIFFFHPAVWWIEKQLSVEREMACDDAVLAETANPRGYATCLVSLLEKSLGHRGWSMAQAAVHRAREASMRLAQILDSNRPAATRIWKPALGMIGGLAAVCLMALPLAPPFVAFDRGMVNDPVYPTASSRVSLQSSLRSPAIIPAALRTDAASPATSNVKIHAPAVAAHKAFARKPDALQLKATHPQSVETESVVEARANVIAGTQPQYQTLVFVEATQYGNSDFPVWRLEVWRVTLVSAARERIARVPVAKSI